MVPETRARLCAVVPAGLEPRALDRMLAAADVAALLLAPDAAVAPARLKALIEAAQAKNIAALIEGDSGLARTLCADGVHLPWSKDIVTRYREAREVLGSRFIVGADAGRLRDDAMTLGEAGADYVGFGIPPHVEDRETARARRLELVGWWSEIFEVPCVAFDIDEVAEAARLTRAGADFVAMRLPEGADPARWANDAAATLDVRENVA